MNPCVFKDSSFPLTVVSWEPLSFGKGSEVSKPFRNDVKVFSGIIWVGYPPSQYANQGS